MVLGGVAATLAVLAVAGIVVVGRQLRPPGPVGVAEEITVAKGLSNSEIGELLERRGIIRNATFFRYYVRFSGVGTIEAGNYSLRRRDDLSRIVEVLQGGATAERGPRLTVPEGLTLPQVAEVVGRLPGRSAQRFLELARGGTVRSRYQPEGVTDLEGLLVPETYEVGANDDEAAILRRMVEAFDTAATEMDIAGASARLGVTPYQAVIVASLVEREARVDQDRGPVARVVYNRLARRMMLQIDATVQYALGVQKERLLYSDLEVASPYNTYKVAGLPPGPIASPGRAALRAALDPPPGPWLYYVLADADGRHAFTETSAEFERLKAEAQRKGLL